MSKVPLVALAVLAGSCSGCTTRAGDGLRTNGQRTLAIDPSKVPDAADIAPCRTGQVLTRSTSGWSCSDLPGSPPDLTHLESEIKDLQTANAGLKERVAALEGSNSPEAARARWEESRCPPGWSLTAEPGFTGTLCTRKVGSATDEMVKVSDFWIDRFEMSLCGGSAGQLSGEGTTAIGCSVRHVVPAHDLTWFQAAEMCANAGKSLCSNEEWQVAATGTPDPGNDGGPTGCNVSSNAGSGAGNGQPAQTMAHKDCVSRFGAYDLIGNVWEWVADWYEAGRDWPGVNEHQVTPWPAGFGNGDGTWNINGEASTGQGWQQGVPAAGRRGGDWDNGSVAGIFAVYWDSAPSDHTKYYGARCCI